MAVYAPRSLTKHHSGQTIKLILGTKRAMPCSMRMRHNIFFSGTISVLAAFLLGGCTTIKITEPPRTATEQLLLSTAADHALHSANLLGLFANRKVFLETAYFDSYDPNPILPTSLRQHHDESAM